MYLCHFATTGEKRTATNMGLEIGGQADTHPPPVHLSTSQHGNVASFSV
jgi:hypothetical protein